MTPILNGVPVACCAGALYQTVPEPVALPPWWVVGLPELGAAVEAGAVVAEVVALVEDFDDELHAPAIMATALMKLANRTVDFRPLVLITKAPPP